MKLLTRIEKNLKELFLWTLFISYCVLCAKVFIDACALTRFIDWVVLFLAPISLAIVIHFFIRFIKARAAPFSDVPIIRAYIDKVEEDWTKIRYPALAIGLFFIWILLSVK